MNYKLKRIFCLYTYLIINRQFFHRAFIYQAQMSHDCQWIQLIYKKRETSTIENYKHDEKPFDKCCLRALSLIILSTNTNKNYEMSSFVWFLCGKIPRALISTTIFFLSFINFIHFSVDFSRYLFECRVNTFKFIWICYSTICNKKNRNWCLIVTVYWWK